MIVWTRIVKIEEVKNGYNVRCVLKVDFSEFTDKSNVICIWREESWMTLRVLDIKPKRMKRPSMKILE